MKDSDNRGFGTQKGLYWKTTQKINIQLTVQDTVTCLATISIQQFTANGEVYCRRQYFDCMTLHVHTRPTRLLQLLTV